MKKTIHLLFALGTICLLLQNCQQPVNRKALQKEIADSLTTAMQSRLSANEAILDGQIDCINSKKISEMGKFVASDCVTPTLPPDMKGLEGMTKFITMMTTAFPDLRIDIHKETVIREGDWVSHHVTMSGTNSGSFMGMPPTNKNVKWNVVHTARVKDGKIVEFMIDADRLGMMQQLGAIPMPKK